jgi:hypothetical protein
MNQSPKNRNRLDQPAPESQNPNHGRRRFVIAGLAAAPLIMTLSARPAFAQTGTVGYKPAGPSAGATSSNGLDTPDFA